MRRAESEGTFRWGRAALAGILIPLAGSACASTAGLPGGEPLPDAETFAAEVRRATLPDSPRHAIFGWSLDEAGSRVRGRGAARFEAPERLRLDLFGPRGESYLSAALVGDEYVLPPQARGVVLPSPALLWGAVGVLRPPAGAPLTGAYREGSATVLRYDLADGEVLEMHVDEAGEAPLLTRIERRGRRGTIETLELEHGDGDVVRARYRNWAEYRDLTIDLESIEDVPSFPESIWNPAAPGA